MGYAIEHEGKAFTTDGLLPDGTDTRTHNERLAAAEVAAFKARESNRWFAYASDCGREVRRQDGRLLYKILNRGSTIRTFTGLVIAEVTEAGAEYQTPSFGTPGKRQNFRARGIDGRMWSGTFYVSSGDYVRMRVVREGA